MVDSLVEEEAVGDFLELLRAQEQLEVYLERRHRLLEDFLVDRLLHSLIFAEWVFSMDKPSQPLVEVCSGNLKAKANSSPFKANSNSIKQISST